MTRKLTYEETTTLLNELGMLLDLYSIPEAVTLLEQGTTPIHQKIAEILQQLQAGETFENACKHSLPHLENFNAHLLSQAIDTGKLNAVLHEVLIYRELREQQGQGLTQHFSAILNYYLLLAIIFVLCVIGLLTQVIPVYAELYHSFRAELPYPTNLLLNFYRVEYLPFGILIIAALIYLLWNSALKTALLQRLPFTRGLFKQVRQLEILGTLNFLLKQGMSFIDALAATAEIFSARQAKIVRTAHQQIVNGTTVATALQNVFSAHTAQSIMFAQQHAQLPHLLQRFMQIQSRHLQARIVIVVRLFNIMFAVVFAACILLLLLGMYAPIFKLGSVI